MPLPPLSIRRCRRNRSRMEWKPVRWLLILMRIRVLTRHSEDFDIHTVTVDPAKSTYAHLANYTLKVTTFYRQLGIRSAIWARPESDPFLFLEMGKELEYVLEVNESRVAAYVEESTWSAFLYGKRDTFDYSLTRQKYQDTSVIIPTPIEKDEVMAIRRYRSTNGPGSFELVEEKLL